MRINQNKYLSLQYRNQLKKEIMTAEEVKKVLSDNRELVINYYNDNCKADRFYNLKWFMTRVLEHAIISWKRRKNIGEKEIMSVINGLIKYNQQMLKGYVSNYQKAVNYYGRDLAEKIANAR